MPFRVAPAPKTSPATPFQHLYLHVPFCPRKCDYCAFVTHIGSLRLVDAYVEALCSELKNRSRQTTGGPLQTVYFGGGTPSMLHPNHVVRILQETRTLFGLEPDAEVTLEAHPETVTPHSLAEFQRAGVTRLSIGGESLNARELRALRRQHAPDLVEQAVSWAASAGFRSVALDLMYGLPGQSEASWLRSLQRAANLDLQHLSLYPLMVEAKTTLSRRQREGRLILPRDETVCRMYETACVFLRSRGYEHYEVANWTKPGFRCEHNLAIWRNREFLGAGVGAHGYVNGTRTENMKQTKRYIDRVLGGGDPRESVHVLTPTAVFSETVILGLRLLQDGLDLAAVFDRFGIDIPARFARDIARFEDLGWVRLRGNILCLTESAAPLANEVWSAFVVG